MRPLSLLFLGTGPPGTDSERALVREHAQEGEAEEEGRDRDRVLRVAVEHVARSVRGDEDDALDDEENINELLKEIDAKVVS